MSERVPLSTGRPEAMPPRERVQSDVEKNLMDLTGNTMGTMALDPETGKRLFEQETTVLLNRMQADADSNNTNWKVNGLLERMGALEKTLPAIADIVHALTTAPVSLSEKQDHPYLSCRKIAATEDHAEWYYPTLRVAQIRDHRALLAELAASGSYQMYAQDFAALDAALATLQTYSPLQASMAAIEQKLQNNYSDKAIWKMLGIAGFCAAVAGGAATGISALANGRFPAGALAFFTAAVMIGNKDMRDSVTKGLLSNKAQGNIFKSEKFLSETDTVLNNDKFHALCTRFNIRGKKWSDLLQELRKPDTAQQKALHRLRSGIQLSKEEAGDLATVLTGNAYKELQPSIVSIIEEGAWTELDLAVRIPKDVEAQSLVYSYIEGGAWMYKEDKRTAEKIESDIQDAIDNEAAG